MANTIKMRQIVVLLEPSILITTSGSVLVVQVIDLLFRQELKLRLHVIGDLARSIRWVHSSESRDPAPYLNGEEVVLTTGAWFTDEESVRRFVNGLMEANVAALGFGTHDEMPTVPIELILEAKNQNLTLFEVPSDVTFISISKIFVDLSIASHEQPLRENALRNAELLGILQRQVGLEAMLNVLSRDLPGRLAVLVGSRVLAQCGPAGVALDPILVDEDSAELLDQYTDFVRYPLLAGPSPTTLIVENFGEQPTSDQQEVIDQVISYLIIERQRFHSDEEISHKYAEELFDFIETSPPDHSAIFSRMRSIGMRPESPMVAVCIEMSEENEEEVLGLVNNWLDARPGVGLTSIRHGEILALLPATKNTNTAALATEIHAILKGKNFVGLGTIVDDAKGVNESIIQSQHACRFAARRRDTGHSTYDALASHLVLLATQTDQALEHFEAVLLQPLIAHDTSRHSELVHTLQRFLALNGQFQIAADDLHVHVNTLRQRLSRIEELTSRDLSLMENRVDFWLALEARKLRKKSPRH